MRIFHTKPYTWPAAALLLLVSYAGASKAAVLNVSNCNDTGSGSLRNRIAAAASGDTIDLSHLMCDRITLTSGQIVIPQDDLRLVGRSRDALTVDGGLRDRVFWHRGAGRLRLERLSIANGYRTGPDLPGEDQVFGGCVRSDGNLDLDRTRIHHCTAISGQGGGVAAPFGDASVSRSLIVANVALGQGYWTGSGAGVFARHHTILDHSRVSQNDGSWGAISTDTLEMSYSLVDHNISEAGDGIVVTLGPVTVLHSTIADNDATGGGVGGLDIINLANTKASLIADSTISRNRAEAVGAVATFGDITVVNTTIAFNEGAACPGAFVFYGVLHLESTIVASNPCAGTNRMDLGGYDNAVLVGSHDLVGKANLPLPSDTLRVAPRLAPLANNGGPTPTNALLPDSPAIDRGNNILHLSYDQRGVGYPRVKGARADIGAFER